VEGGGRLTGKNTAFGKGGRNCTCAQRKRRSRRKSFPQGRGGGSSNFEGAERGKEWLLNGRGLAACFEGKKERVGVDAKGDGDVLKKKEEKDALVVRLVSGKGK